MLYGKSKLPNPPRQVQHKLRSPILLNTSSLSFLNPKALSFHFLLFSRLQVISNLLRTVSFCLNLPTNESKMAVLIISFSSELKRSMLMMAPILASFFSVIVRASDSLEAQKDTLQETTPPLPQDPQYSTSLHVSAMMSHEATAVTP